MRVNPISSAIRCHVCNRLQTDGRCSLWCTLTHTVLVPQTVHVGELSYVKYLAFFSELKDNKRWSRSSYKCNNTDPILLYCWSGLFSGTVWRNQYPCWSGGLGIMRHDFSDSGFDFRVRKLAYRYIIRAWTYCQPDTHSPATRSHHHQHPRGTNTTNTNTTTRIATWVNLSTTIRTRVFYHIINK